MSDPHSASQDAQIRSLQKRLEQATWERDEALELLKMFADAHRAANAGGVFNREVSFPVENLARVAKLLDQTSPTS